MTLITKLHSIRHVRFNFRVVEVTPESVVNEWGHYLESLMLLGSWPLFICLLFFIPTFLVYFRRLRTAGRRRRKKTELPRDMMILVAAVVVELAMVCTNLIYLFEVYDDSNIFTNSLKSAVAYEDGVMVESGAVRGSLASSMGYADAYSLEAHALNPPPPQRVYDSLRQVMRGLNRSTVAVNNFLNTMNTLHTDSSTLPASLEGKVSGGLLISCLLIFLLLASLYFLAFRLIRRKRPFIGTRARVLGACTMLLWGFAIGCTLVVAVLSADLCMSPTAYALEFSTAKWGSSSTTAMTFNHYLTCNSLSPPNPLNTTVRNIEVVLAQSSEWVGVLSNYSQERASVRMQNAAAGINTHITAAITRLKLVEKLLMCDEVHGEFTHAVHHLCDVALPETFKYFIFQIVGACIHLVLVCIMVCSPPTPPSHEYEYGLLNASILGNTLNSQGGRTLTGHTIGVTSSQGGGTDTTEFIFDEDHDDGNIIAAAIRDAANDQQDLRSGNRFQKMAAAAGSHRGSAVVGGEGGGGGGGGQRSNNNSIRVMSTNSNPSENNKEGSMRSRHGSGVILRNRVGSGVVDRMKELAVVTDMNNSNNPASINTSPRSGGGGGDRKPTTPSKMLQSMAIPTNSRQSSSNTSSSSSASVSASAASSYTNPSQVPIASNSPRRAQTIVPSLAPPPHSRTSSQHGRSNTLTGKQADKERERERERAQTAFHAVNEDQSGDYEYSGEGDVFPTAKRPTRATHSAFSSRPGGQQSNNIQSMISSATGKVNQSSSNNSSSSSSSSSSSKNEDPRDGISTSTMDRKSSEVGQWVANDDEDLPANPHAHVVAHVVDDEEENMYSLQK